MWVEKPRQGSSIWIAWDYNKYAASWFISSLMLTPTTQKHLSVFTIFAITNTLSRKRILKAPANFHTHPPNFIMTKLLEWLCALLTFLAIYVALLHNQAELAFLADHRFSILVSPLVLIAAFGVSCLELV